MNTFIVTRAFWGEDGVLWLPSILHNALPNVLVIYVKMLTQRRKTSSYTAYRKHYIIPLVSPLMNRSSPNAIARFVVSVVIYTLYFPTSFPFAHVFKKMLKRIEPPFTDCDTALSVINKAITIVVCASAFDSAPDMIDARLIASGGMAVRSESQCCSLYSEAAARARISVNQAVVSYNNDTTTVAIANGCANPLSRWRNVRRSFLTRKKSGESLSDDVSFGRHNGCAFTVIASGGRPTTIGARCDFKEGASKV